MSITISITIPDQLERDLKEGARIVGISRSRFTGNILLDWQKKQKQNTLNLKPNDCKNRDENSGMCSVLGSTCGASQKSAESCTEYVS